jgi:hypothetical protein
MVFLQENKIGKTKFYKFKPFNDELLCVKWQIAYMYIYSDNEEGLDTR